MASLCTWLALALSCYSAYAAFYEDSAAKLVPLINSRNGLWKAGYNPSLAGKSEEDLRRMAGVIPNYGIKLPKKPAPRAYSYLPTNFVAGKDKWQKCDTTINYIKDQGTCGSCWAVSSASIINDRTCIVNHDWLPWPEKKKGAHNLNEDPPLIDRSQDQITGCKDHGCGGGAPSHALKFWQEEGVVSGGWFSSKCGCKPYSVSRYETRPQTPPCPYYCESYYTAQSFSGDKIHADKTYSLGTSSKEIMQEIYDHGPVVCDFLVYNNFHHYKEGIYDRAEGGWSGGMHAIKVIGWGEENGTPYWLINNSYNVTWGMNGQFKMLRGQNLAGIERECVAGTAKRGEYNVQLKCYD